MKNTSIFSDQDHAVFFRATREINKHLHHIKEYDQIGDIEDCFAQAKDIMIGLARQIGKIMKEFERIADIKVENNKALGEEIIEKVFGNLRNAVSIDEKLDSFKKELFQIYVRKSDIFEDKSETYNMLNKVGEKRFKLLRKEVKENQQIFLSSGNTPIENIEIPTEVKMFLEEIESGEIDKVFKKTNKTRRKASEQIIIIFQKIIELQRANAKYFEMLKKPVNTFNTLVNEKVIGIERDADRIQSVFNNIDCILNKSCFSRINCDAVNALIDGYYSIVKLSEEIRENLLDLNIERYKFRGVSFYYAPNKGELLKRRYANIRKGHVFGQEMTKEELIGHIQNSWEAVIKENNLSVETTLKDDIENFLTLTCHDTIEQQQKYIDDIETGPALMEEDILRRTATILGRLNMDDLKEYFGFFLRSGKIKRWKEFTNRIQLVTPKRERHIFDTNWQLNVYLEKMSFKKLLDDIISLSASALEKEVLEKFRKEICSLIGIKKSKDHPCIQLKSLIIQNQNKLSEGKINEILTYLKVKFTDLEKKYKEYIEPEIAYYLNCSKKHVKDATSKISSHLPTDYQPEMIKNVVLKEALSKRDLKISKKFRKVFKCIDEQIFRHEKPKNGNPEAYTLWQFFWDNKDKDKLSDNESLRRFDEMVKEVVSRLEELKVRKYNLLNEYLHSDLFSDINNRLQIYGGSFSIWNQEEEHLVRMLARRFTPKSYRPHSDYRDPWFHQHALHNKWYDLPERIYDKTNGWIKNPFKDTIELMFLSEGRLNSQPAFYQNFSSDSNALLDVEKENQFLFCEDGEIGAFILLYRFMNAIFNTSVEQIEKQLFPEEAKPKASDESSEEKTQTYLSDILKDILVYYECIEEEKTQKEKADRRGHGKKLLKDFIEIILDSNCPFKLHFASKTSPDNVYGDAYDPLEGIARKEKFPRVMRQRIDRGCVKFVRELFTQGLLETGVNEETTKEKKDDSSALDNLMINEYQEHFTISERYINLCKFIDKELTPSKKRLKLKANFQKHNAEINPEGFFIDRKIQKLGDYGLTEELEIRSKYLDDIRKKIIDVVKEEETTRKIEKSEINKQLSSILSLLIESVTPFLVNEDFKNEKTKENRWLKVKRYISGMSRFPLSAYFVWRANQTYSHSRLVIPIASTTTNQKAPNVGFLSIGFRNVITSNGNRPLYHITHETEDYIKELLFTIRSIYQPLVHPFMDRIYYDQIVNKSVQDNAMKAAVARVMARNLSHNIGSHVLGKLSDLNEINNELDKIVPTKKKGNKKSKKSALSHKKEKYQLLAQLNAYIRERMDFIADISTTKPLYVSTSTLSTIFNDFYLDENNCQKLLLQYISGIQNMTSKNIKIIFHHQDSQIAASIPHDRLGYQAFYVILENIIRNIFKHTNLINNDTFDHICLEITVHEPNGIWKEKYSDLQIKILFYDSIGNCLPREKQQIKSEPLDVFLNKILDTPILDKNTKQLRTSNWGLLEIKIAAAYLRRISISEIDQKDKKEPPIVKIKYNQDNDLIYSFLIEKPMEILLIYDGAINNKTRRDALSNQGIRIIHPESNLAKSILKFQDNYYLEADYNFLISETEDYKGSPVQRILKIKGFFEFIMNESIPIDSILTKVWMSWIMKNTGYFKIDAIHLREFEGATPQRLEFSNKVNILNLGEDKLGISKTENKNNVNLILDNHGFNYHEFVTSSKDGQPNFYHAYYSTNYVLDNQIENITSENPKDLPAKNLAMLLEGAQVDIAIIDERVQYTADFNSKIFDKGKNVNDQTPVKRSSLLELAGIFTPPLYGEHRFSLENKKNISRDNIFSWLSKRNANIRFLLIHIGVIEMAISTSEKDIEQFVIDVKDTFDIQVIFISGRGLPSNLPDMAYFLNNSVLMNYLFNPLNKFKLIQVLYSLRRIPKKNS